MADDSDYIPNQTETETETDTDFETETENIMDLGVESVLELDSDMEENPRIRTRSLSIGSFGSIRSILKTKTPSLASLNLDSDTEEEDDDEIDTESTISKKINDFITEDDIEEIRMDVYALFDEYIETNILKMMSPKFYNDMVEYVSEIKMNDFLEGDICNEDDFEEVVEHIQKLLDLYLDISDIPKRSGNRNFREIQSKNISNDTLRNQIEKLKQIPQPAQRTPEWYEFRNGLLSASNLWKAFVTESQMNSLIYEKCKAIHHVNTENTYVNTESSLHWGVKYEPVSVIVYESMFQTKLSEFGCIRHEKYPFIGASPDGINCDESTKLYGRMVEIKNIVNREITGIPKLEYWVQTQIQMETCDLEECDFFETRFSEYKNESEYLQDKQHEYKGIILNFIKQGFGESGAPIYKYMPLEVGATEGRHREWVEEMKIENRKIGLVLYSTIYWYLDEFSCVFIERNHKWFESALPKIREIWEVIIRERDTGFEHRATKKRIELSANKITVSETENSDSYILQNMPNLKPVCLVKLGF
jgi:hypothetical protein